ncbi:hypothetical protein MWN34_18035 [Ancylobacter sp. 6x-1]|uniref:Uncharacterized protein n=1 Tax=Ancylobacter crimeensis TaxID=2579147 RepID=A0ABT0DFS2_9HYPH|nr:hypothetical protein [Ancylobacter crimeensis]MCK0198802.1 hypothetical protein [Ancylobacter crimeensis]
MSSKAVRRNRGAGRALFAGVVTMLALLPWHRPAYAVEGCLRTCLSDRIKGTDDDAAMRDALRACRESCLGTEADELKAEGLYDRYAQCRPSPLSDAEFHRLRSGNPSFLIHTNALIWEMKNVLPDKVIRSIEVTTQSLSLSDTAFSIRTLIPPGHSGTIVMMNFFAGYPAARFATRLTRIEACPLR